MQAHSPLFWYAVNIVRDVVPADGETISRQILQRGRPICQVVVQHVADGVSSIELVRDASEKVALHDIQSVVCNVKTIVD